MDPGSNFTPLILESMLWPQGGCLCTWEWVMLLLSRCSEQGGGYSEWERRGSWEQHPGQLAAPSTRFMEPILHYLLTWIWCLFLEIIVQILVSSFFQFFSHLGTSFPEARWRENWTGEKASLSPGPSCVCTSTSPQKVLISLHGSQTVFPYLLGKTLTQRAPF